LKRAEILADIFLNDSKQKLVLLQRKEEAARALQTTDVDTTLFSEIFTVSSDLMGLTIGSKGSNIQKARELDGVDDIILDEGAQLVTVKVICTN
jgi:fragile X mental retardation protein